MRVYRRLLSLEAGCSIQRIAQSLADPLAAKAEIALRFASALDVAPAFFVG